MRLIVLLINSSLLLPMPNHLHSGTTTTIEPLHLMSALLNQEGVRLVLY